MFSSVPAVVVPAVVVVICVVNVVVRVFVEVVVDDVVPVAGSFVVGLVGDPSVVIVIVAFVGSRS